MIFLGYPYPDRAVLHDNFNMERRQRKQEESLAAFIAANAKADVIKHVERLDELKNGAYDRTVAAAVSRVLRAACG